MGGSGRIVRIPDASTDVVSVDSSHGFFEAASIGLQSHFCGSFDPATGCGTLADTAPDAGPARPASTGAASNAPATHAVANRLMCHLPVDAEGYCASLSPWCRRLS